MSLVNSDETPVAAVCALEKLDVRRAQEQVLQHGVVRQEQMRWRVSHLRAAQELIGQPGLAGIQNRECLGCFSRRVRCVTDIAAEGDMRCGGKDLSKPLDLI